MADLDLSVPFTKLTNVPDAAISRQNGSQTVDVTLLSSAAVNSVNGATGVVVLDAGDVGYDNTGTGLTATTTGGAVSEVAAATSAGAYALVNQLSDALNPTPLDVTEPAVLPGDFTLNAAGIECDRDGWITASAVICALNTTGVATTLTLGVWLREDGVNIPGTQAITSIESAEFGCASTMTPNAIQVTAGTVISATFTQGGGAGSQLSAQAGSCRLVVSYVVPAP